MNIFNNPNLPCGYKKNIIDKHDNYVPYILDGIQRFPLEFIGGRNESKNYNKEIEEEQIKAYKANRAKSEEKQKDTAQEKKPEKKAQEKKAQEKKAQEKKAQEKK